MSLATIEQTKRLELEWDAINWHELEYQVDRLQKRIFRATQDENWSKTKSLQKLFVRSRNAKLLAIRKVTQLNSGKLTPGIDNKLYITSEARMQLYQEINFINYQPRPVKRVYILKADGRRRPLGIPTILDRVVQTMVKMALEPAWEARFEPNSYGFRPGRRCQDAIQQIRVSAGRRKGSIEFPWILDADITGCFDNINHEELLNKLSVFKPIVLKWLKAGLVENGQFYKIKTGVPQGSIIGPLLANIALDGLERLLGIEDSRGRYIQPSKRKGLDKGVSIIRYADDFIVIAPTREIIVNYALPKIKSFLEKRGLIINERKTRILSTEEGFNFLGFAMKQIWDRNHHIFLTVPSKQAVKRHLKHIKEVLSSNKQAKVLDIVETLNPIIRGWANYFRHCHAKKTFNYIDHRIWQMLWQWCVRRHPRKTKGWVKRRYFRKVGKRDWIFQVHEVQLISTAKVGVAKYYIKVGMYNSPYDPKLKEYWKRRGTWAEILLESDYEREENDITHNMDDLDQISIEEQPQRCDPSE